MAPTISSTSTSSVCPVPPKVIIDLSSSSSSCVVPDGSTEDEATSKPRRRGPYRRWHVEDEVKILTTMATLRRRNMGKIPLASVIFRALDNGTALRRRGVDVVDLSQEMFNMKMRFKKAARHDIVYKKSSRCHGIVYKKSAEVWPDLLAEAGDADTDE